MNKRIPFRACLLLLSLLVFDVAVFTGCNRTLAPEGVYKGDDALYHADNSIVTGKRLLDTFVTWEKDNRVLLWQADQGVKKAADHVRANAKDWVKSAIALREAYALNPTPEKRDALQTTLNILDAAINQALVYFSKFSPDKLKL